MVLGPKTSYAAGDEIDARCTKCKMVLAHTIVAMVGDKIARVRCNTCMGEHAYRPPPSASEASAARRRAERKSMAPDAVGGRSSASEFGALMQGKDPTTAKAYSIRMDLRVDDLISHTKFGVGLVTEIREGSKAHVAFEDGGRVLVYGR